MNNTVKMTERQTKEEIAEFLRREKQTANYDYRICLNVISDLFTQYINDENKSFHWFIAELEIAELPGNVETHEDVSYFSIFDYFTGEIYKIGKKFINEKFEETIKSETEKFINQADNDNAEFVSCQSLEGEEQEEEEIEEQDKAIEIIEAGKGKTIGTDKAIEIITEKVITELQHYRDFHFDGKNYGHSETITRYNFSNLIEEIEYIIRHKSI